jgi:NAD(P)-dependent dehydrogenase (short-subunit alcohol dehydrogenase family)
VTEPAHVTLVAGSAQGIGRAITAERLAALGAVLALDVDPLALDDLAAWAAEAGHAGRLLGVVGEGGE